MNWTGETRDVMITVVGNGYSDWYSNAKTLQNRKVADLDKIPPEVYNLIFSLCNAAYEQDNIKMEKMCILLFSKKGDLGVSEDSSHSAYCC